MNANEQAYISLPAGLILTISLSGAASATLTEVTSGGAPLTPISVTFSPYIIGPFVGQKLYRLQAVNGAVTYAVGPFDNYPNAPRVLQQSAVAITAPADANENILATITVPGGVMGPNGAIQITSLWSFTNNINAKTPRLRIGGAAGAILWAPAAASLASISGHRYIWNRGAENSQVSAPTDQNGSGTSTGALVTTVIDTSQAFDLVLTGQKATAGDTLKLEAFSVEVLSDFN